MSIWRVVMDLKWYERAKNVPGKDSKISYGGWFMIAGG